MGIVTLSEDVAQRWARTVLKAEMHKAGIGNQDLAEKLQALGLDESEASVRGKVSRGTFTLAFFGACMEALRVQSVSIDLLDFAETYQNSPTLQGSTRAELDRLGRYVRLPWSWQAPSGEHEVLVLPDKQYSSRRANNSLQCGQCLTDLFPGWRPGDAKRVFSGSRVLGQCSVCHAYVEITGSSVRVPDEAEAGKK